MFVGFVIFYRKYCMFVFLWVCLVSIVVNWVVEGVVVVVNLAFFCGRFIFIVYCNVIVVWSIDRF